MLAPLHGPHDHFVVLLKELALHLKLLINLASLAKVDELSVIVARLMPVVHVVRVLH